MKFKFQNLCRFCLLTFSLSLLISCGTQSTTDTPAEGPENPETSEVETPPQNDEFQEFLSLFPAQNTPLRLTSDRAPTGTEIPFDLQMEFVQRATDGTTAEVALNWKPGFHSLIIGFPVRGNIWYYLLVFNAEGERLVDNIVAGDEDGLLYDAYFPEEGKMEVQLSRPVDEVGGTTQMVTTTREYELNAAGERMMLWEDLAWIESFEQLNEEAGGSYSLLVEGGRVDDNHTYKLFMQANEFVVEECKNGDCQERGRAADLFARKNQISIPMKGVEGELIPVWTLKRDYQHSFRLHVRDYDVETDRWTDEDFLRMGEL